MKMLPVEHIVLTFRKINPESTNALIFPLQQPVKGTLHFLFSVAENILWGTLFWSNIGVQI
jgi:hypothetical protein